MLIAVLSITVANWKKKIPKPSNAWVYKTVVYPCFWKNTDQSKGTNYGCMPQPRWVSQMMLGWVKEARLKRLHNRWVDLYDVWEKTNTVVENSRGCQCCGGVRMSFLGDDATVLYPDGEGPYIC